MPYITKYRRDELKHQTTFIDSAGELNYKITEVILKYLETHGKKYSTYNDIIGALECAKLEVYRRVVAPHEEERCKSNGDVF